LKKGKPDGSQGSRTGYPARGNPSYVNLESDAANTFTVSEIVGNASPALKAQSPPPPHPPANRQRHPYKASRRLNYNSRIQGTPLMNEFHRLSPTRRSSPNMSVSSLYFALLSSRVALLAVPRLRPPNPPTLHLPTGHLHSGRRHPDRKLYNQFTSARPNPERRQLIISRPRHHGPDRFDEYRYPNTLNTARPSQNNCRPTRPNLAQPVQNACRILRVQPRA